MLAALQLLVSRLRVAGPDEALVISGAGESGAMKIVPPGGKVFVVPIVQSVSKISLEAYKIPLLIDCLDRSTIPLDIEAVAMVKIGSSNSSIRAAAERFNGRQETLPDSVVEVLSGTLRSVAGRLSVSELISDREMFSSQVAQGAEEDLARMGITVDTLQIKDISDKNDYIMALGAPEAQRVSRIARVATAENETQANEAEAESKRKIAEQNKDLEVYQAEMKRMTMEARAVADAAEPIERAKQEKLITLREQEVAEQKAVLKERELEATVRKPADAERYRVEVEAEARKVEAVLRAEADARARLVKAEAEAEAIKQTGNAQAEASKALGLAQAEADKAQGLARAEAEKAQGLARAEAEQAQGLAEATAMDAKAEALEKYGQAAIIETLVKALPQIAGEYAKAYEGVDKMTVISTDGTTALTRGVTNNVSQLNEVIHDLLGIDLGALTGSIVQSTKLGQAVKHDDDAFGDRFGASEPETDEK
ncbi:SPFH domain-containing protein [Arcanobacterium phocae]|uniref:SPFH domain-containing protein n=1 Tax=Arcanobacterium phocae TaxID=131112 RepID=UPI001C0ED6EE|nr:SPFH domain-containing protein [Arcanobacterium phocae]